jgi:hypothetical protein
MFDLPVSFPNTGLLMCLSGTYCALVFADLYVTLFRRPPWKETWTWYFGPLCCLSACSVALWGFVNHNWVVGVEYSMFAAIGAYSWWHDHHQRRKRIAERVAGRVTVTDGGLKVVPD